MQKIISRFSLVILFFLFIFVSTAGAQTPPPAFSIGDNIQATKILNVRSSASSADSSNIITTVQAGTTGTITDGPTIATGYTWWKINFGSVSGWSAENFLVKANTTNLGNPNPASTGGSVAVDLKAGFGPSSNTQFSNATTTSDAPASNPLVVQAPSTFYLIWTSTAPVNNCRFAAPFSDIAFPSYQNYIPAQQNYVEYAQGDIHYPSTTGTTYTITCTTTDGTNTTVSDSVTAIDKTPQQIIGVDLTASVPGPASTATFVVGIPTMFGSSITNLGTVTSGPTFVNQFKIATDAGGAGAVSLPPGTISTTSFYPSYPGVPHGIIFPITSPSYTFTSAGTYYVQACADSGNVIVEVNETNNCSAWTPVTVYATQPPGPIITSISPSSATPLSTTPIIVTGTNFGAGTGNEIQFSTGGQIKYYIQTSYSPGAPSIQFSLFGTSSSLLPSGTYALSVYNTKNQTVSNSLNFMVIGSGSSVSNNPPPPPPASNTTTCLNLTSVIAEGSSGTDVISLQNFLRSQGLFSGVSDGKFGPITASAVSAFQSANGIDPVGSVGPVTRAKISAISCGSSVSNPGTTAITPPCPAGMIQNGNSCVVYSTSPGTTGGSSSVSLKANGTSGSINIGLGTPVILSWTVPTSVTSACFESSQPQSSFSGPLTPVNNGSVTTYTTSGTTVYTITCGDTQKSVTVNTSNTAQAASGPAAGVSSNGGAFSIGDTVTSTVNLNVRSSASINAGVVAGAPVPSGTTGTIVGGPTPNLGYTWWQISFSGGISGWSVGNYLTKINSGASANPGGLPPGCTATSLFSTITGQPCSGGTNLSPGCTSTTGFSTITGQSCGATNSAVGATTYLTAPNAFNIAVLNGLEPNTTAGLADFQTAHASVTIAGGRKALLIARPELAALLACSMTGTESAGRTINDVTSNLLLVNNQVANSSEVDGIWTDIWGTDPLGTYGLDPNSPGARYTAAVNKYIGYFVAGPNTTFGLSPAQKAVVVAQQAWNAALKGPVWTAPPEWWTAYFGSQGSRAAVQIPLPYIFFGPTSTPDGTVYLAWNDPRDGKDYVYRWPGPTFKPSHISFPSANPYAVTRFNMAQQPQNIQGINPWVLDSNNDMYQLPDPGTGAYSGTSSLPARVQALFLGGTVPTLVDPLTLLPK